MSEETLAYVHHHHGEQGGFACFMVLVDGECELGRAVPCPITHDGATDRRTHWTAAEVRDILVASGFTLNATTTISGIECAPEGITAEQIVEMQRALVAIPEDEGE